MQVATETVVFVARALRCEQEISVGNVIGGNIITITLVFGLVALIRSLQVSLSDILSNLHATTAKIGDPRPLSLQPIPYFLARMRVPKFLF